MQVSILSQRCQGLQPARATSKPLKLQPVAPASRVIVRATADEDAELEKRIEKLRLAKGATPYGQGTKAQAKQAAQQQDGKPAGAAAPAPKKTYDYTDEKVHYEGAPSTGDLVINLALGTTLVWLPLTLAAVGRAAFVKYRLTDKRITVITTAPWKSEQLDAAYAEVKSVVSVGRAFGLCGDIVVELNNGDKVEMLRIDQHKELEQYILARRDALAAPKQSPSGRVISQAELMGEEEPKSGSKPKGFA